jgi:hypothetical protein
LKETVISKIEAEQSPGLVIERVLNIVRDGDHPNTFRRRAHPLTSRLIEALLQGKDNYRPPLRGQLLADPVGPYGSMAAHMRLHDGHAFSDGRVTINL